MTSIVFLLIEDWVAQMGLKLSLSIESWVLFGMFIDRVVEEDPPEAVSALFMHGDP